MPTTTLTHTEKWELEIRPDADAEWPDIELPKFHQSQGDKMLRIERFEITVVRGCTYPLYVAVGKNARKDGTKGVRMHRSTYLPDWAKELCREARRNLGVTEELTGVPM